LDHKNGEVFVHVKSGSRTLVQDQTLESGWPPGFAVLTSELFAIV